MTFFHIVLERFSNSKQITLINASQLQNSYSVIPAKAGIQSYQCILDPGFRRGDEKSRFCNWFTR